MSDNKINKEILNLLMSGMSSADVHRLVQEASVEKARLDKEKAELEKKKEQERKEAEEIRLKAIRYKRIAAENIVAYLYTVGAIEAEEKEALVQGYYSILEDTAKMLKAEKTKKETKVMSFEEFCKAMDDIFKG